MSGFIAMSRDALNHPALKDADRFRAWFWLVANAAWKPTKVRIKGETITLNRGELSFSQRFLAESWGWSKSRVDRFIADLRTESMIETRAKNGAAFDHKAGQGQSIISICNYDKYQSPGEGLRGNDLPASGATAGQQRGKEEQGNKGTREDTNVSSTPKPPKHVSAKGWPVIPDWVPAEPWNGFIEMRKIKGAYPTPRAVELLIRSLDKMVKSGCDPGEVLDQSTTNNWTGIFAPKGNQNGNRSNSSGHDQDGFTRAIHRSADRGRTDEPSGAADRSAVGAGGSNRIRLIAGTDAD